MRGVKGGPQACYPKEKRDFRPERVAKARKRRGRLVSFLLVVATLIAAFGALAWWMQTSGLLDDLRNSADTSTPPARVSGEDFSGEDPIKKALDTQSRFSSDWRAIFAPGDTAKLSAGAAGRFEAISTGEGPAVRVTSTDPDRDGAAGVLYLMITLISNVLIGFIERHYRRGMTRPA